MPVEVLRTFERRVRRASRVGGWRWAVKGSWVALSDAIVRVEGLERRRW